MKAKKYTKETIHQLGITPRNFPKFAIGDTIAISQLIKEGDKERIQMFEGDIIAMHNKGASSTFTVRRIGANAVAVEKIFPYYSPLIAGVKFIRKGKVRRAKLYYIRERIGKAARVREQVLTKEEKAMQAAFREKNIRSEQTGQ
ncbi:MAG: 50S ribosomal protein L19 [Candidatus Babeliales bacterium]